MKKSNREMRKLIAWVLCLAMLSSVVGMVALAAPDEDAPAVEAVETPVEREEVPAVEAAPAAPAPEVADEAPVAAEADLPAEEGEADLPAEGEDAQEVEPFTDEEIANAPEAALTPSVTVARPFAADVEAAPALVTSNGVRSDALDVDWSKLTTYVTGASDGIQEWGLAKAKGGYYLYFVTGPWGGSGQLSIRSADGDTIPLDFNSYNLPIHTTNWAVPDGATSKSDSNGQHQYHEVFIPAKFFPGRDFSITCSNITINSARIVNATELMVANTQPDPVDEGNGVAAMRDTGDGSNYASVGAGYRGIEIDGDISDWDGVPRYPMKDIQDVNGTPKYYDTVDEAAVVWDGDWVYILLGAYGDTDWQGNRTGCGNWDSVCGAGPNNNGQLVIVTDLNNQLLVQPVNLAKRGGTGVGIAGVENAQVAVNNTDWTGAPFYWEIAIPTSELPEYLESINFGLYLVDPAIKGITNLAGQDDTDKTFNGITFDGKFDDWKYYPMTTIEYATPGTQDVVRDAHGALWADGSTLYGYVATGMQAHLNAMGGDFLAAIHLAFNGDRSFKEHPHDGNFYPRIISVDSGEPVVLNEGTYLDPGDYTFYIYDIRTDPTAGIQDPDTLEVYYPDAAYIASNAFGRIKIHIDPDRVLDQAEFELDLNMVADYIDKDGNTAFQTIEIQWGRLGQQWITYSGSPTGPVLGVALAIGAVSIPACVSGVKNRKKKETDSADDAA